MRDDGDRKNMEFFFNWISNKNMQTQKVDFTTNKMSRYFEQIFFLNKHQWQEWVSILKRQ